MFDTEPEKFYYYKYNSEDNAWYLTKEFENKNELIRFLAENHEHFFKMQKNFVNYTGNDTIMIPSVKHHFELRRIPRNELFCNDNDKIIDIRNLQTEVEKLLPIKRNFRFPWFNRKPPEPEKNKNKITNYRLHIRKNHWYRKTKSWFHNRRSDHIPEYEPYIRHKGKIPHSWGDERIIHKEKSWKYNTKNKKQWQTNINPHHDTYIIPEQEDTCENVI